MITNIGFNRNDATHTIGKSKFAIMPSYELLFPIKHPEIIRVCENFDMIDFDISFSYLSLHKRVIKKIYRMYEKYMQ